MFRYILDTTLKFTFLFCLLTTKPVFTVDQVDKFNLDGIMMNVVKTSENGVVNQDTIFIFSQNNDIVTAEYKGGKILKGFLVGKLSIKNQLEFSYCQMQLDGKLDNGLSSCQLSRNDKGKLILIEHFEWKSRPGEFGINIFQEL